MLHIDDLFFFFNLKGDYRQTQTDSGYRSLQKVDYAEVTSVLHWATFM